MKHGDRLRAALEAGNLTRTIAQYMRTGSNLNRLYDAQSGLKAARYDSDLVNHTSASDPTGSAATVRPDQPAHDLAELDHDLALAVTVLERIRRRLAGYGEPREANDADRLALAKNAKPEPRCANCATITEPNGNLKFNCPPSVTRKGPTHCGVDPVTGKYKVDPPRLLCDFCIRWTGAHGKLPGKAALIEHRDRSDKVKVRVDPKRVGKRRAS
jgi:hypothetical protein